MLNINRIIKLILRNVFGLEIFWSKNQPLTTAQQEAKTLVSMLQSFGIDLVLDVGANTGQFASEIRRYGYAGKIVSFEPLSQAHDELLRSSAGDPMWNAYSRCALGDHEGEAEINIAGNSESSSILPMLESHRSAAPSSAYQGKEMVPVKTLDAVAGQYLGGCARSVSEDRYAGFRMARAGWRARDIAAYQGNIGRAVASAALRGPTFVAGCD